MKATVKTEEVIQCGADWREHPNGEKATVTTVTIHHDGFDEVVLPADQRFNKLKKQHGGPRPGAGRKPGPEQRKTTSFKVTEEEKEKISELLKELRK